MDVRLRISIDAASDLSVGQAARALANVCRRLHQALEEVARQEATGGHVPGRHVSVIIDTSPEPHAGGSAASEPLLAEFPATERSGGEQAPADVVRRKPVPPLFTVVPYVETPSPMPRDDRRWRGLTLASGVLTLLLQAVVVCAGTLVAWLRAAAHAGRGAVVSIRLPRSMSTRDAASWSAVAAGIVLGVLLWRLLPSSAVERPASSAVERASIALPLERTPPIEPGVVDGDAIGTDAVMAAASARAATQPARVTVSAPAPASSDPASRPLGRREADRLDDPLSAALVIPAFDDGRRFGAPTYTGSLVVESEPAGARVFINQVFVGRSPLVISRVRAGSYAVQVQRDGYERWSRGVRIVTGRETRLTPALQVERH